jgi:hypothetical protein
VSDKLLLEIRDSQIRMEGKMETHDQRIGKLEEAWSRVTWGILGCVGIAIISLVLKVAT